MELGSELRRLRKHRRSTLVDVSKETGISVSFLSDIERGRTRPSLDTLEKLSSYYQVSVNDILVESDVSNPIYPPGYQAFLDGVDGDIDEQMQDLLFRTEARSKNRPETKEDWMKLYYSLKSILGE